MIFKETKLKGAYIVEIERLADERGFFARSWCQREFEAHSLSQNFVQCNISYNEKAGTLRGMHYQSAPFEEGKLVRCTMGAAFDVIIDLRPESPTFKEYVGVELTCEARNALYIPKGFAHGFITLKRDTEIFYQMTEFYVPSSAKGVRWNDSAFNIQWPIPICVISKRDANYPDFTL